MKIKTSLLTLTAMTGLLLPLTAQITPKADIVPSVETITSSTLPTATDLMATYNALKLTSYQKSKLAAIAVKYKSALNYQVNLVIQNRRQLRTIINTVPTNESAIRAQSSVVAGAETELAVTRGKISADVQAVLTPAQISQLKSVQTKIYAMVDALLVRIRTFIASL